MSAWLGPEPANWWDVVDEALREDIGTGDLTAACFGEDEELEWIIEAQADGVACGVGIAEYIFGSYNSDSDPSDVKAMVTDGSEVRRGTVVLKGQGLARRVLSLERTALNFLMLLSGVATLTRQYVDRVRDTSARIVDTRKTLPGLRSLQKYAVRCGGGFNHRMGLYDAAMIKDNHIKACGDIAEAVRRVRAVSSHLARIEVECEDLEQVRQAVQAGADVILLDNMDPFMMREAVRRYGRQVAFEASGGISLETVHGVAQTGVSYISVGALTHSAPALPYHLEVL